MTDTPQDRPHQDPAPGSDATELPPAGAQRSRAERLQRLALSLAIGLAAVVIPGSYGGHSFWQAVNRGRQKRTMADVRSVGTSVEAYAIDHGFVPAVYGENVDVKLLAPLLMPTYIKQLPLLDAWQRPLRWSHAGVADEYSVRSTGKNGRFEDLAVDTITLDWDSDLVFSNGQFTVWPGGTMT